MLNANGILIQGLDDKTNYVKGFFYEGINAYFQFPLTEVNDTESRILSNEQQLKKIDENHYVNLEFISNLDLYERYVKKCFEKNIRIRALFLESGYPDEIWKSGLPKMEFIGYEYCPIPIDEQIITDMDWYQPFSKYRKVLNEYGLFDTYRDVEKFAVEYYRAFLDKKVGDGAMDAYICRVSQICF